MEKVVVEAGECVVAETYTAVIFPNALERLLRGRVGSPTNEAGAVAEAFAALVVTARRANDDDIEEPFVLAETSRPSVIVVYSQPGKPAESIDSICCWNVPHDTS